MPIAMRFTPASMSADQYDTTIKRLEEAGAGKPNGRLYHVTYQAGGGLHVFDVWDSQESFDKFGQTLMPILQELGIDTGQPQAGEVHNIIEG